MPGHRGRGIPFRPRARRSVSPPRTFVPGPQRGISTSRVNQFNVETQTGLDAIAFQGNRGVGAARRGDTIARQGFQNQLRFGLEGIALNREALGLRRQGLEIDQSGIQSALSRLGLGRENLGLDRERLGLGRERLGFDEERLGFQRENLALDEEGLGVDRENLALDRTDALQGVINNALQRGIFRSGIRLQGEQKVETRVAQDRKKLDIRGGKLDVRGKGLDVSRKELGTRGKDLDLTGKSLDVRGKGLDIDRQSITQDERRLALESLGLDTEGKKLDLSTKELKARIALSLKGLKTAAASRSSSRRAGIAQSQLEFDQFRRKLLTEITDASGGVFRDVGSVLERQTSGPR